MYPNTLLTVLSLKPEHITTQALSRKKCCSVKSASCCSQHNARSPPKPDAWTTRAAFVYRYRRSADFLLLFISSAEAGCLLSTTLATLGEATCLDVRQGVCLGRPLVSGGALGSRTLAR